MNNKTIAVALSGGVDSAAAAYLLKKQGYNVFGITMKLFDKQDCNDAALVADALNIKHYIADFSEYFENEVIDNIIDIYLNGHTPNPCITCNIKIKYGALLEKSIKLGADYMALGHYAKIEFDKKTNLYRLLKSDAIRKDQSYFLYHLTQDKLRHIILPLNSFPDKDEVRSFIAGKIPFIASKKDSTDICFTNGKPLFNYIKAKRNLINCEGNFIDINGKYIAKHRGIFNYTIGQKRGLDIKTNKTLFILKILPETNEIMLTENEQDLYEASINVSNINYINSEDYNSDTIKAYVKLCQWGYFIPCKIINQDNNKAVVKFDSLQRAPAKGQAAVFYKGNEVVGGGTII